MRVIVTMFMTGAILSGCAATQSKDSDHDGVVDGHDKCPDTAQIKKVSPDFRYAITVSKERLTPGESAHPVDEFGCEFDTDNDGVVNSQDYCPEDTPEMLSMGIAKNGCPKHSDQDGTPDYRDKCPDTPRGVRADADGCPL